MSETQDNHTERINRLYRLAIARPVGYALQVRLLVSAAYLALAMVVLLGTAWFLLIVVVVLQDLYVFIIPLLFAVRYVRPMQFARIILTSVWVPSPIPSGREIGRNEAPELYTEIDRLTTATGNPNIDRIVLTNDFGFALTSVRSWKVPPKSERYMTIGYQLLAVTSPEGLGVLLTAGMQRQKGLYMRLYLSVVQTQQYWERLWEQLRHRRHWAVNLINPTYTTLTRRCDAHKLILTRLSLFDADTRTAEQIGADRLGVALLDIYVRQQVLNGEFWPKIFLLGEHQEEPPESIHIDLTELIEQGIDPEQAKILANQALLPYGSEDGFPTLAERLKALGLSVPDLTAGPRQSAARKFLSDSLERIAHDLDISWRNEIAAEWKYTYRQAVQAREQLDRIKEKVVRNETVSSDEMLEYAAWIERTEGVEQALPLYRQVLENDPTSTLSRFLLGRSYLATGNDEGVRYIEKSMRDDRTLAIPGLESIYGYMSNHGRHHEAETFRQHYLPMIEQETRRRNAVHERAVRERARLDLDGGYIHHSLSPEQIEELRHIVGSFDRIDEVYLVRKHLVYFPERPLYVFGIVLNGSRGNPLFRRDSRKLARQMADRLRFLGDASVVVLNHRENKRLRTTLEAVSGAHLYRRQGTDVGDEHRNNQP